MPHTPRRQAIDLPKPAPAALAPPMPPAITPAELDKFARQVFGEAWKSPLARACNVSRRTMHRWADGTSPIPTPVVAILWLLLGQHDLQTGAMPRIKYVVHKKPPRPSGKIRNPEKFVVE